MTTIATADRPVAQLVEQTKALYKLKGLNPVQAAIWWDELCEFGIGTAISAIDAAYADDIQRERPVGEPRLHSIKRHARRLGQEDWNQRRIGSDAHPDNEDPEIRMYRLWWESWRRDSKIEMPAWAQEILDEHAAHGVALEVWRAWSEAHQEYLAFHHTTLAWAVFDERCRMNGGAVPEGLMSPGHGRPDAEAAAQRLPLLHKRLLDLPKVHYKTEAAKLHWIDRVEFAAAEFEVELEGATKGYTRDEVPF